MAARLIFPLVFALTTLPSFAAREIEPSKKSNIGITQSAESSLPAGSVTGSGRFSDGLQSGWMDALVPFASAHGFTFFGNLRGTWDDDSQALFNSGLGVRYLVPGRDIIIGGNIYYDRIDSSLGNQFDQLGLGAELLTRWFDARFNYYLPDNGSYLTSVGPGLYRIESGIEGWNTEAGFLVPWLDRFVETRLFGGYYEYQSRFGSHSSGWKARGEIRWTPGIITDLEWWEDKTLNGGNWVAGVRVSLPFEIGNLFRGRNPFAGARDALRFGSRREFKQRLGETVIRSHRVQSAKSGLLVDSRYLRPVTVTVPSQTANATGGGAQTQTQTVLVYDPGTAPTNNGSISSGSFVRVNSNTSGGISGATLSLGTGGNAAANNGTANVVVADTLTSASAIQLGTSNTFAGTGTLNLVRLNTGTLATTAGPLTVGGGGTTVSGGASSRTIGGTTAAIGASLLIPSGGVFADSTINANSENLTLLNSGTLRLNSFTLGNGIIVSPNTVTSGSGTTILQSGTQTTP